MPSLVYCDLPIDHCDLSASNPRKDNWVNCRWWMNMFYRVSIISWWQFGELCWKFVSLTVGFHVLDLIDHSWKNRILFYCTYVDMVTFSLEVWKEMCSSEQNSLLKSQFGTILVQLHLGKSKKVSLFSHFTVKCETKL